MGICYSDSEFTDQNLSTNDKSSKTVIAEQQPADQNISTNNKSYNKIITDQQSATEEESPKQQEIEVNAIDISSTEDSIPICAQQKRVFH